MNKLRAKSHDFCMTALGVTLAVAAYGCGAQGQGDSADGYEPGTELAGETALDDSEVGETAQALKNGTATSAKPGIGNVALLGGCTGSLISPRHVLTAAHCNLHLDTLSGSPSFTAGGVTRSVSRIFIIGAEEPPGAAIPPGNTDLNPDVAILELSSAIPAANATPLLVAAGPPAAGTQVTTYGFGPNGSSCTGTSSKRFFTFNFGSPTTQFCPGDSGGPGTYFSNADNGAIWGVTSFTSSGGDVWGNVSRYKEDILSVIRMWNFNNSSGINGSEAGFRRNGVAISTTAGVSAATCRSNCNANSQCNSYQHTTSTNTCKLLRDAGDWVPDSNSTSGLSTVNRFETNVDRPGFDYANYISPSRNACSLDCSDDSRCAAFTYVTATSRCFLKEYLGLGVAASGIVSGTKRGFEFYTDRAGSDISDFDVMPGDVRMCQTACSNNASCFSYTFRAQQFTAAPSMTEAHCWLKNSAPAPVTNVADPPAGNKRLISGTWRSTP